MNLHLQKIYCLVYLLPLILPLVALYSARATGRYNEFGWWLVSFYVIFVGIDHFLGKARNNPSNDQLKGEEKSIYYSFLLFLSLAAVIVLSVYGAYFFCHTDELNWAGRIGWIISLGVTVSALALPAGHELIHRESRIDNLVGSFLFAYLSNAAYKIEHIRGHHIHVATPEDTGYINLSQSLYHYLPRALINTFANAWLIEKERLNRLGIPAISWRNEFISWHLVSLSIAAIYYFIFGLLGIIYYFSLGLTAMAVTHIINYMQHYGLERRKMGEGRYEKFSAAHAWNCNYLVSNLVAFGLPRHTDHHLRPRCPYQLRQHIEQSPQMPTGYFGMFLLALIPPLWFRVMNPRILAYRNDNAMGLEASGAPDGREVMSISKCSS